MSKKKHRSPPEENKAGLLNRYKSEDAAVSWLEAIIESAEDAIISKTLAGIITSWNNGAQRIFGYTADEIIGKHVTVLFPPENVDEELHIIGKIGRGERIEHFETVRRRKDGADIEVALTISPIKAQNGEIVGASKIVRDITSRKLTERKLKEQSEALQKINDFGKMLSAQLEVEKLVQSVTDSATSLTGAEFGSFFYNVENADGESYMLYTLSGVPIETFENFPMPRNTAIFGPTFRGEGTVRIGDVKKDPRYGKNPPYHGMPEGHLPVTSYLAVPVKSVGGDVIGGLFFGHSAADVFTELHEQIVEGLAAQTAIAMDNARLYENAKKAVREKDVLLESEQRLREQAEEAGRAKDEFLGLLSHELRTPLNSILGWTQMLGSRELDDDTFNRAVDTIARNARLQAKLIDDMLDVSRIIAGKLRLDAQAVDLPFVINSAIDTLRPAAEAKGIRLYVTLDFGSGAVLGDPTRLQQVVWNLLSNAIKFTPKSGSVYVTLEKVNSHFDLTVSDTGPGIDADFLPYVFERFRQADSSTAKKFGGLGLGLAIVRQLVEMHGGTVMAANRSDNTGAVFTVRLPVMIVKRRLEEIVHSSSDSDPVAENADLEGAPRLDGVRVLAVDDEPDARMLIKTVLEQSGAEVQIAESSAEALSMIDNFQPDALVSDIGMPDEDGYTLIRQLRSREAGTGRKLPAVALTAFARAEDRMKALAAGYSMHVPKPVEPAELLLVISTLASNGGKSKTD
ncbi:MAG TPA: ATP-binding protein [Pyrinomonadaceae bacterium]|nr:ATP-binding protein [Pyrinomonadaceae bacterium]